MAMSLVVSWACVGACFVALVFEIQAVCCQCHLNTLLAAGDFASAGTIKHTLLQCMGQISCVRSDQLNAPSPLLASIVVLFGIKTPFPSRFPWCLAASAWSGE